MKLHHGHKPTAVGQRSQQNAGRFLCFKPIGVEFEQVKDKALSHEDIDIKIDSGGEKASKRKGFSRALKAVIFRSKSRTKNSESRAGEGSCSVRSGNRKHEAESDIGLTKSSSMRSTSSSCSSSSSCLSSHPSVSPTLYKIPSSSNPLNPKPPKQSSVAKHNSFQKLSSLKKQEQQQPKQRVYMMGVVLIVISLTLTIFWGRLWAIGLNAVWLCSIPRQGRSKGSKTGSTLTKTASWQRSLDTECSSNVSAVEQKRRVIMEGLLDRRHHHHIHHHQHFHDQEQLMH